MNATKILDSIQHHVSPPLEYWRVIKQRPRVHPYDGMELPIPSSAWLYLLADSPQEAAKAVAMAEAYGIAEVPNPNTVDSQHVAVFKYRPFHRADYAY